MRRITLIIIVIAAIVGIAGFYYYQKNIYSKEILKLEILGQEGSDLLEEIEYIVKYKNNGDTRLEDPELIFEFPEYTVPSDGESLRIVKTADDFGGSIYPGQEGTFRFRGRLMGKEGEAKEAKAILSYRPKNLKARYESPTTFTTVIEKVPLTFDFDLPSKIESAKEMRFRLNYFSNTDYPLTDLRVVVEYPSNFEFIESSPNSLDKTEWNIGLLNKAEGGRIEIVGKVMGEVSEEKVFKAKFGSWQDGEFIVLKESTRGITIIKPALHISPQINGSPEFVAGPGDYLHYEILFRNVGENMLTDLSLLVTLSGSPFDFNTIRAPEGEYEPGDNSIVWDWRRVGDLQLLSPNEEGKIDFWIELKEQWPIKNSEDKNPTIRTKVYLSQVQEEFVNKISSKIEISQKGFFGDEVFGNSGPIPPEVGESTTYTIMWQAKNYYNETNNVMVKATLPENSKLTGKIFPEEQADKFTFDSQSRELVWNVGELMVAQGILNPAPNIAFQISFVPSSGQRGQTPVIINEVTITGQDTWAGEIIRANDREIITVLPDDPSVNTE
ncbi:MAG: hypothetical protein Q8P08_02775 [bacterium]|nr:hypothetical protein [bacterium]